MTDLAKLRELLEKATKANDVQVSWYSEKLADGTYIYHPQFETETGLIAQEEAYYELYCAARNGLPALLDEVEALRAALQRIYDMAERPMCLCGTPTGTAAIKAVARPALGETK